MGLNPTKTGTLAVPGATLYHEARGAGPVLLLICGGVCDASGYAGLAERLADRYTVVTYDRRGNSRSPLDGPPEPQRIEEHGEDAHRILAAVGVGTGDPAYVFGNSSGAMIGLELAARHPEQVRAVVAHEPPVFELLAEPERWRALLRDVEQTFARDGAGAAMAVFDAGLRMRGGAPEDERSAGGAAAAQGDPDPQTARMMANMAFFIGYEVPTFGGYVPDLAALRISTVRVVPAAGEESAGEPPHQAAFAVAQRLGTATLLLPGDHGGFGTHADAFAGRLHRALAGE